MSLIDSFAAYIATVTSSTLGQTLFISQAPSSNKVADSIWWIVENGGSVIKRNATGESNKSYQIDVYYRNRSYQSVKNALYDLEEKLNCSGCVTLSGYDTIEVEATTFPIDQDLDNEDRLVGLLQATILIYKEC